MIEVESSQWNENRCDLGGKILEIRLVIDESINWFVYFL